MLDTTELLDKLEQLAPAIRVQPIRRLECDRWIASSVMQKAIRRGDVNTALSAAMTLWRDHAVSFWRRLHIVSVEDVGVAAPEAVAMTLTAFNATTWRRKRDDLAIGLALVKLLAEAVKCRLGDEVYTIAANDPAYEEARRDLTSASDQTLCDTVLDVNEDTIARAVALWSLAGTKRLPADRMPLRDGNKPMTMDVLRSLNAPAALTDGCISAMGKTMWPLALFTPLLWQAHHGWPDEVITRNVDGTITNGIPHCAVDTYTRVGKASIREFQKSVADLASFTLHQIGMGVFYVEGFALNKRLSSPVLDDCRDRGAAADLAGGGLPPEKHSELVDVLKANLPLLQEIRKRRLLAYFAALPSDLFGNAA